jgi:hypothetical protein
MQHLVGLWIRVHRCLLTGHLTLDASEGQDKNLLTNITRRCKATDLRHSIVFCYIVARHFCSGGSNMAKCSLNALAAVLCFHIFKTHVQCLFAARFKAAVNSETEVAAFVIWQWSQTHCSHQSIPTADLVILFLRFSLLIRLTSWEHLFKILRFPSRSPHCMESIHCSYRHSTPSPPIQPVAAPYLRWTNERPGVLYTTPGLWLSAPHTLWFWGWSEPHTGPMLVAQSVKKLPVKWNPKGSKMNSYILIAPYESPKQNVVHQTENVWTVYQVIYLF